MNISLEEKKVEALARMKQIGIFAETIKQFDKDGYISISEPPFGAYYWIEGEDLERIREFEKAHNALVFTAIRSFTSFGTMDCYLFVSDYPEEWKSDRRMLDDKEAIAYVYNRDDPDLSEMGSVGFALTIAGGLRRTW